MSKKNIISFYYKHKAGGFTTRLYKAWLGLAKSDYHIVYISTEELPVDHQNIEPHIINCRSKPGTIFFWLEYFTRAIFSARQINKKKDVYCFFVFSFFYSSLAVLAGLGNNIKTVVFIRADDLHTSTLKSFSKLRMQVHLFLEKFSISHASLIVATNKNMRDMLKNRNVKHEDKISYLPNDIVNVVVSYENKKYSLEDQTYRFVTASALNEGKNILYTLKALNEMSAINWEFIIIGDDIENTGYGEKLKEYIENHKLMDKVKLLGWQNDADQHISRCDLFILSTLMEGSPNALLEALGTKVTCMGSDIPEVSEILNDPELVFDLGNPLSLTNKLDVFCSDSSYRDKLANLSNGCRKRYSFDWEKRVVSLVEGTSSMKNSYS